MRRLEELIDTADPAWPLIQSWIAAASDRVIDVLPPDGMRGEDTLLALQISSHAALGAIALETGGILVDYGWLRLLGSGNARMQSTLLNWNGLADRDSVTPLQGALVVAYDAVGGFFAANGGAWTDGRHGEIFYLAPDCLQWENLQLTYSDFLRWVCLGDIRTFYQAFHWPTWSQDVKSLDADHGWLIWPPLIADGPAIAERTKRIVPQHELWAFELDIMRQMKDLPAGTKIRFNFNEQD